MKLSQLFLHKYLKGHDKSNEKNLQNKWEIHLQPKKQYIKQMRNIKKIIQRSKNQSLQFKEQLFWLKFQRRKLIKKLLSQEQQQINILIIFEIFRQKLKSTILAFKTQTKIFKIQSQINQNSNRIKFQVQATLYNINIIIYLLWNKLKQIYWLSGRLKTNLSNSFLFKWLIKMSLIKITQQQTKEDFFSFFHIPTKTKFLFQ
ncbi:hypothetical protein ABPG72_008998 [Tetrahymena utriculariae]